MIRGRYRPAPNDRPCRYDCAFGRESRAFGVPCPWSPRLAAGWRRVQGHGGPNERLQGLLVQLVALVEIDRAPGVALEAGVEEAGRVRQGCPLGEGHLHNVLVGLAG